ncbi:MAG: discoidin domain-containing protein [Lentisphaeria bacterium]|nr:discoidin domain-containing protein [Lentisphaeria bacterium]
MKRFVSAVALVGSTLPGATEPANLPLANIRASHEEHAKYAAGKAVDGNLDTHWAAGNQLPHWLEIEFEKPIQVDQLLIRGVAMQNIYDNWSRISISFSSGASLSVRLADTIETHTLSFPARVTTSIRITIESTYKQSHYIGCSQIAARYVVHGADHVQLTPRPKPIGKTGQQLDKKKDTAATSARLGTASRQDNEHPNLWVTLEDVERAKQHVREKAWAQSWFHNTLQLADKWVALSDRDIRERVPLPGSLFNRKVQCPLCGKALGASFSHIRSAHCSACKRTFPDADHPDDGRGWVNPETGETHFFTASYNEYAIDQFERVLQALADAYALTGDEKFAHTASVLFDQLAVTYPTCTKGPEWYPSDNPTRGGRLDRPYYQVARMLIWLADAYDLLYHSPEWELVSVTGKGTRRENTEQNIIRNGGDYCFDEMTDYSPRKALHNGFCDYLQGVLACGRLLGLDDYVTYDLTCELSIFNFLENTIDRDGQYTETALMYSSHAIELYCHHAEMLRNWRSPDYPAGINLYDHPKLRLAMLRSDLDTDCAGHVPPLGDTGPDVSTVTLGDRQRPNPHIQRRLEYLAARSGTKHDRQTYMQMLASYVGDVDAARSKTGKDLRRWLVYNAVPPPDAEQISEKSAALAVPDRNTLLPYGRGIGILRSGGLGQDAALLRWGPTNNHGTADEMNVNFFSLGKEITYDPGYLWAHFRCGWTHATGSHNLVVVNERNQLQGDGSGGDLEYWIEAPGFEVMSADNPQCYSSEKVSMYRRTVALVEAGPGKRYFLDIFRVRGGQTHDYNWHFYGEMNKTDGIVLPEPELSGSLAGPQYEWWKKVQRDGWLTGVKAGFYWSAPPGNGYGFLHHLQRAPADGACAFEWQVGERHAMATLSYPGPAIAGESNGRYANVLQTGVHFYRGEEPGDFVEYNLPVETAGRYAIVAVMVKHARYGIVQASVDGEELAEPLNNYSPTRYHTTPIVLGTKELRAGTHKIRFTVVGKDAESSGCFFGLKCLGLEKPDKVGRLALRQKLGVRLSLLPQAGTQLIAARAKGTIGGDSTYVISRRKSQGRAELSSAFAAVVEPFEGTPAVESIERLQTTDQKAEEEVVALGVHLANGSTDLVFDAIRPASAGNWRRAKGQPQYDIRFAGRFGVVQMDRTGSVKRAILHGNGHLEVGDFRFSGDGKAAEWEGVVERVDLENRRIHTRASLPVGEELRGLIADFANPAWSRRSPFRISHVSKAGDLFVIHLDTASLVMAKGKVAATSPKPGFIVNSVPLDRAGRFGATHYFQGRSLLSDDGDDWGLIKQVTWKERFDVISTKPITPKQGTTFSIVELSAGDRFRVLRTQEYHAAR